ncbi:MAG: hypothetical protein R6X32_09680 [Chloroflexota bacterium]
MINNKPPRTNSLWLVTVVGLAAVLLLLSLSALSHQPTAHAQQTPREILVNAQCSPEHEHIRFGQESSHYYWFWAKRGLRYQISTNIFDTNQDGLTVDTRLLLYRHSPLEHPGQHPLAESDDLAVPLTPTPDGSPPPPPQAYYQSAIYYIIPEDGYYWVQVENIIAGGEGSYCLQIMLLAHNPFADRCEPNGSFAEACEIQNNTKINANFAGYYLDNAGKPEQDERDFYKLWVATPGLYECKIVYRSNIWTVEDAEINLIFYDHDRFYLDPDTSSSREGDPANASTSASVNVGFPGWLYILAEPDKEITENGDRYAYELTCAGPLLPTPTPTPTPTSITVRQQTAPISTATPTYITPTHPSLATSTPHAMLPGPVAFVALSQPAATATPDLPSRSLSFTIQVYYDRNDNQSKDPDEGIANLPIYIYADSSDKPLQTTTSQGGAVMVGLETSSPSVQLVIPYLGVSQEIPVGAVEDIQLRIVP